MYKLPIPLLFLLVALQKKMERDKRKEEVLRKRKEAAEKKLIAAINERNIKIYPESKKTC